MKRELLQESNVINIYVVYQILKKLTTPFEQTAAFRLGIIDKKGNVLKKRHSLKTHEEEEAYTHLDLMVWKLKRLLEKIPGGKSRLASFAAALWLITENASLEYYSNNTEILCESFQAFMDNWKPSKKDEEALKAIENLDTLNESFKLFEE